MAELEARHAFDVYEEYTKTGDDEQAQVYLKSEADKVIANQKRARCLAMANWCETESNFEAESAYYEGVRFYQRWRERWLKIADKFKEAK